ncbi:MAG TPA: hypothetical protein VGJ26_02520 [Pirellulales bacterium]
MPAPPRRRWFQWTAPVAVLLIAGASYCTAGLLMYRQRRIDGYFGTSIWNSDILIFLLPAMTALIVNGLIVGCATPSRWPLWGKSAVVFAASIALTLLEFCAYMVIAANRYGV